MVIVTDSSPLISLAILKRLKLLNMLYDDFFLPEEVYNEVITEDKPYSKVLRKFLVAHVKSIKNKLAVTMLTHLDKGEAEAIILALENNISRILIDDYKGRKTAKQRGLIVVGTLGLLLNAKKEGLLDSVKNNVELLQKNNMRISKKLYHKILKIA